LTTLLPCWLDDNGFLYLNTRFTYLKFLVLVVACRNHKPPLFKSKVKEFPILSLELKPRFVRLFPIVDSHSNLEIDEQKALYFFGSCSTGSDYDFDQ